MTIPVMRPVLPDVDHVASRLRAIQLQQVYSNFGPQVSELEARFAELLRVAPEQVASASNATLAITGAIAIADCRNWVVPSFTFTASVAAAQFLEAEVRFGDIDAKSWWLNPGEASQDTGVITVAPFGSPVILEDWNDHESVVLDAAASLGTTPDLSQLPGGWCTVFSLHATKVLGAGEGGLAVFGDIEDARRFRMWSNFGFFGSRESRIAGLNAKMSEMQAAYANAALDGWEEEREEWSTARDLVLSVGDEAGLETYAASRNGITPYWIVVFPDAVTTDIFEHAFEQHRIGTRRWWSRGCHRMPAYSGVPHGPLPVTEDVADRYLGLPLYRGLSREDAERIHAAVQDGRRRADAG